MGNEVALGFVWLHAKLSGDTQLMTIAVGGVHRGSAPPGTVPPFVIIGYQAGRDKLTMNGVRMLCKPLYQVKAVGPATMTVSIMNAAHRLDELLNKTPVTPPETTPGGLIDSYCREEPLQYDEVISTGAKWSNFGGLYRLEIEEI